MEKVLQLQNSGNFNAQKKFEEEHTTPGTLSLIHSTVSMKSPNRRVKMQNLI